MRNTRIVVGILGGGGDTKFWTSKPMGMVRHFLVACTDREAFEKNYLPDSFMARMHKLLTPHIRQAQLISPDDYTEAAHHPITLSSNIDWETSKQQTRNVLESISPSYAEIFDRAFEENCIDLTKTDTGNGGGCCGKDRITYRTDGTINDPIYLTHEFGHWITAKTGNLYQSAAVNEWQGFFMQYAQLDALMNSDDSGIAEAVRNHKRQELLLSLKLFNDRLRVLEDLKSGKISKEYLLGTHGYTKSLHQHETAAFIGLTLFEKYKNATPQEQEKMRRSLFETTKDTSYKTILKDFDLFDAGKLEHTMRQALQQVGLNPPQQHTDPEPQGFS